MKHSLMLFLLASVVGVCAQQVNHKDCPDYRRGRECYLAEHDIDKAMLFFNSELSTHPDNGSAYTWRGLLYYQLGDFSRVATEIEKALSCLADDTGGQATAINIRGRAYVALGEPSLAMADFCDAISLQPSKAVYYNNRGELYQSIGDIDKARQDFNKVLTLTNDAVEMGRASVALGEIELSESNALDAIKHLLIALESLPSSKAYMLKAEASLALQDNNGSADEVVMALSFDENVYAQEHFGRVAPHIKDELLVKLEVRQAIDPDNFIWPWALSKVCVMKNSFDEARRWLAVERDLRHGDGDADYYNSCAMCYFIEGEHSVAYNWFGEALGYSPDDCTLLLFRSVCADYCGMYSEALSDIDRIIELNPEDYSAYCRKGWLLSLLGRYDDAIAMLSKALLLNSDDSYSLYVRGTVYKLMGDSLRATDDFNGCVDVERRTGHVYNTMFAYCQLGQSELAVQTLSAIEGPVDIYDKMRVYAFIGDNDKALDCIRQMIANGYKSWYRLKRDLQGYSICENDEFKSLLGDK